MSVSLCQRRWGWRARLALLGITSAALVIAADAATTTATAPRILSHTNLIELDNQIISPVTQQYIVDAIARSESDGAVCLVIMLDTPGGLLESTRGIVKRMMNAKVPIVVYVAPSGSRAGSAGVFITLAAHVAAMAPSTNIGAAHPVGLQGGGPVKKLIRTFRRAVEDDTKSKMDKDGKHRGEEEIVEETQSDPMAEKVMNDTVAWITTIAKARGRNETWAAKAVTESVSVTETEAVKDHIVDLIAADVPALLAAIEGRTVELAGIPVELHTANSQIIHLPMSRRQEFLTIITNPNIAYLLMLLGTLGLIFEFTHPGLAFPGIAGLICLLLALYAFQALPVSYAAIGLLLLGLVLLIAEVKIVSHGLLGISGVVALTLGSLMLFESPGSNLRVSLRVILPTVGTIAGIVLFIVNRALSAQRHRVTTGVQGLLGEIGVASTDVNLEGKVFVHGELWNAVSQRPIQQGEKVRILRVEGLQLLVESHAPGFAKPRHTKRT
ncbi:MAG: nodulation protein NfeD [Candidatus Omnitrophica bacterium]|nr:nodulation protein NfeD [Candidatus Omnitrophota bacterium]